MVIVAAFRRSSNHVNNSRLDLLTGLGVLSAMATKLCVLGEVSHMSVLRPIPPLPRALSVPDGRTRLRIRGGDWTVSSQVMNLSRTQVTNAARLPCLLGIDQTDFWCLNNLGCQLSSRLSIRLCEFIRYKVFAGSHLGKLYYNYLCPRY